MPSEETWTVSLTLDNLCVAVTCALTLVACKAPDRGPELQIVGESYRAPRGEPLPAASPWFDGRRVELAGARGEVLAIQVLHSGAEAVPSTLHVEGATVRGFDLEAAVVKRPSTSLYGGSRGAGVYLDTIVPSHPADQPRGNAYFEIEVDRSAAPGVHSGELSVGSRRFPVSLTVSAVDLPPIDRTLWIWAYEDPREFAWSGFSASSLEAPAPVETRCIATFRSFGVMLSPDLPATAWAARKDLLEGFPFVPAVVPDDPATIAGAVRAWIANPSAAQIPFAIPIDEPRKPAARAHVRALAELARSAGAGTGKFLFAVTDEPHAEYGDLVDLFITLKPHLADRGRRWTYNGAPPHAGSMVLDAVAPGVRTWGFIGWRWRIPVWYVWDALYWHDRHNRKGQPLPGHSLSRHDDATSFDDGDDHGNLDGVLAVPGDPGQPCRPTLRLAAIRRAVEDRALLDLASPCEPEQTAQLAAQLVPRALGDAPDDAKPAWPSDEASWEAARRELLELAARCAH